MWVVVVGSMDEAAGGVVRKCVYGKEGKGE